MFGKKKSNIEIDVTYIGVGWQDIILTVDEKKLEFHLSTYSVEIFSTLLCVLYHMHPLSLSDAYGATGGMYGNVFDYPTENGEIYADIPYKAEFSWGNDIYSIADWTIQRPKNEKEIFDLDIQIVYEDIPNNIDSNKINFTVPYKDFCYAVIKAADKLLKEYGLLGYHSSTYFEDFNLRYFLKLKAYLLNKEEYLEETEGERYSNKTSIEKELELLMMPMK